MPSAPPVVAGRSEQHRARRRPRHRPCTPTLRADAAHVSRPAGVRLTEGLPDQADPRRRRTDLRRPTARARPRPAEHRAQRHPPSESRQAGAQLRLLHADGRRDDRLGGSATAATPAPAVDPARDASSATASASPSSTRSSTTSSSSASSSPADPTGPTSTPTSRRPGATTSWITSQSSGAPTASCRSDRSRKRNRSGRSATPPAYSA